MSNRIDTYFLVKEEFDLEIAHSQVAKIIIEMVKKYQIDDDTEIKVKLAEIFVILKKAKLNKNINKGGNKS